MAKAPKPVLMNRLIPERYFQRYRNKGWITRDEYIGITCWKFLSARIEGNTIRCYYMREI